MAVHTTRKTTSRFVDWSPVVAIAATGLVFVAGVLSWALRKTLVKTSLNVVPEESVNLDPIQLAPRSIGALRVDVTTVLPSNRWVTYEVLLKDAEGNTLSSAIKQAWQESGTWSEGGESGTWSESDLQGGIDIRSAAAEPITVAILVLEYGDTAGNTINEPVPFRVTVRNGAIDGRYLWVGFIGTLVLAVLSFIAAGQTGKTVINRSIGDSDLGGRAVMGGANSLIKVRVKTKTDETSPSQFQVDLYLKDANGEVVYQHGFPLKRYFSSEDVYWQALTAYFVLSQRASYGFYVEVVPDGPVDSTQLIVQEKAKTRKEIDLIVIENS